MWPSITVSVISFFFFNDTATTEIYTLSLTRRSSDLWYWPPRSARAALRAAGSQPLQDRKSTRLNSSHLVISYAVFCLKKKIRARGPRQTGRALRDVQRVAPQRGDPRRAGAHLRRLGA